MAVAVIVHKAAASTPVLLMAPKTSGLGYIREGAIAVVAIQNILPKTGAENIVKAVVVIVADANAARPANRMQSRFFRNIGESAISVVLIETIARAFGCALQARARQDENVHPAVVVIVNESAAAASRFDQIFFFLRPAVDNRRTQPCFSRYIHKAGIKWQTGRPGPG